jgi:cell division septation protein DedD
MPQQRGASARTAPGIALRLAPGFAWAALLLLGGCDAIYDDTKGWAHRLEASILNSANGISSNEEAEEAASYTSEKVDDAKAAGKMDSAVAPVATATMPSPPQPSPRLESGGGQNSKPQGLMAEATDNLLAPRAAAEPPKAPGAPPLAKEGETRATPPLPKPKPAPPATAAADSDIAMVIHLASLRSEQAAKREWSDLQHSYPDRLGKMPVEIRRTEVGDKGTFYRVLAGPLPSRSEAKQVCKTLKQKSAKQYCQVMPAKPKA